MHHNGQRLRHAVGVWRTNVSVSRSSPAHFRRAYSSSSNGPDDPNVAVLGGGITGLATAYYLTRHFPRARVTIFEAKDQLGGWLSSKRVPVSNGSVLFEAGPRTIRPSANGSLTARLVQELGLQKDTIFTMNSSPASMYRYMYYPDHLVCMPHPSFGFWTNLENFWREPVFKGALLSCIREPFREERDPQVKDESVGDFFSRRFSKDMVDRMVSGLMHGIYAGDIYGLSARSLFPRQWRHELNQGGVVLGSLNLFSRGPEITMRELDFVREMKTHTWDGDLMLMLSASSVFTFRDGLGTLVDALARSLWANENVTIRTSTSIEDLRMSEDGTGIEIATGQQKGEWESFTHSISTLAATHLNEIAGASHPIIEPIPSVTVMTVNLYFPRQEILPPGTPGTSMRPADEGSLTPGFGYLIPRATPLEQNPERALGVIFDNAYSPSTRQQLPHANGLFTSVQDDLREAGSKLTVMLGGHMWNDWPAFPDKDQGLKMARAVIERHLHIKQEPEAWQVNLQKDCIPQYVVGHEDKLKAAHTNLLQRYKGRLKVAGNWMSGVGVNDCLRSAHDVVRGMEGGNEGTGLDHIGNEKWVRVQIGKE